MSHVHQKDNCKWKKHFGLLLKNIFSTYDLDYIAFSQEYMWSTSTIRYWFIGRSLPQRAALSKLQIFLSQHIENQNPHNIQMSEHIKNIFCKKKTGRFF